MKKRAFPYLMLAFAIIGVSFMALKSASQAEETEHSVPDVRSDMAAKIAMATSPVPCLQENMNITININTTEDTPDALITKLQDAEKNIAQIAKSAGVTELKLQNKNYNLYSNQDHNNERYTMDAGFTYVVQPASKGLELFKALNAKKMRASLNASSYNNESVPCQK